jgi:hypothetical protein
MLLTMSRKLPGYNITALSILTAFSCRKPKNTYSAKNLNTQTDPRLRIRICMDPRYFETLVPAPHAYGNGCLRAVTRLKIRDVRRLGEYIRTREYNCWHTYDKCVYVVQCHVQG